MASLGLRRLLVVLLLALLGGSLLVAPASAGADADDRFAGTARLPGCSGAVVRWASALAEDPAVVITNGHCVRSPFLGAREVLVDQKQYKKIELLDGRGKVATTVRGTRLAYASMYRTDLAVYELRESYADLAAAGVTPLTLATEGPSRGDEIRIPSGLLDRAAGLHDHRHGVPRPRARVGLVALDPAARRATAARSAAATPARRSSPARPASSSGSRTPGTSAAAGASTRRARRTSAGGS